MPNGNVSQRIPPGNQQNRRLVTSLLSRFDDAYGESRGHSFKHAVEGLTDAEAVWQPDHQARPITEIILHVGSTSMVMADSVLGDGTVTGQSVERQFREKGGDLRAALALAEQGYETLRAKLAVMTDAQIQAPLAGQKDWRAVPERFFGRMIEHHLYHAGQIVYIRTLYRDSCG